MTALPLDRFGRPTRQWRAGPYNDSRPFPGWWLVRCVKGGPRCPAAIMWLVTAFEPADPENRMVEPDGATPTRSPFLAGFVSGLEVPLDRMWPPPGGAGCGPIEGDEYEMRMREIAWARHQNVYLPAAAPFAPVDRRHVAVPFL